MLAATEPEKLFEPEIGSMAYGLNPILMLRHDLKFRTLNRKERTNDRI